MPDDTQTEYAIVGTSSAVDDEAARTAVPVDRSTEEPVLKVKGNSDVQRLASSISFALQDSKRVTLRAVGAGAVNQMAKACAIARTYVAARAVDLVVRPGFVMVDMDDRENPGKQVQTTAVIFIVSVQ